VPEKLWPIFRDKLELASAADLSETIKAALDDSEALIVVCSPEAARSRWVNEEIRHFRAGGRSDRIYCVIVGGDPAECEPEKSCFPPSLLESSSGGSTEPLAADARHWADGKRLAKLKLVAGLIGVRLDELRHREQQRQRRHAVLEAAAFVVMAALVVFALQSRLAEHDALLAREAQQASAEKMLAEFLDQNQVLGDVADLETRKAFEAILFGYLDQMDPRDLTQESRRQLGVVLSNRGVILREEGELDKAMGVFQRARETLQLLVDESQSDAEALFELSQVDFWIGQVNLDLGRMPDAEASFAAYAEASAALHRQQPDKADWTMEAAYARSNLGNLEWRRLPSDPELALEHFRAALELNELAARQDDRYEWELADSHADVADAWLGLCEMASALEHRLKNVELAARHLATDPGSNRLKQDYANALSGLALVYWRSGLLDLARNALRESLTLQGELVQEDPSNVKKRWNLVRKAAYQARLLALAGQEEESWGRSRALLNEMQALADEDLDIRIDHAVAYGMLMRDLAHLAWHREQDAYAASLLENSIRYLSQIARMHPESRQPLVELAFAYFHAWDHDGFMVANESDAVRVARIRQALNRSGCVDLDIAARLAVMEGERQQAQSHVDRLLDHGYQEPDFRRFCAAYDFCIAGD
jgi:tetratricopeptide (TPR) repeat protein